MNDEQPAPVAVEDTGDRTAEGAVASGILGGAIGALLAATGALVIPGIGPFITGGLLTTLLGGATGWLVGGLVGLVVPREEATYYEEQVQSGRTLVAVRAGDRAAEARQILSRNGGETEPPARSPTGATYTRTHRLAPTTNLARDSGQVGDMMRTASDDGTAPPVVPREAITTGTGGRHVSTRQRDYYFVAKPGLSPAIRTSDMIGPDSTDPAYDGPAKVATGTHGHPAAEADADSRTQLSPADPRRKTGEGQPSLVEANPYGRAILNRQNLPMGGSAGLTDPIVTGPDARAAQRRTPVTDISDSQAAREPHQELANRRLRAHTRGGGGRRAHTPALARADAWVRCCPYHRRTGPRLRVAPPHDALAVAVRSVPHERALQVYSRALETPYSNCDILDMAQTWC